MKTKLLLAAGLFALPILSLFGHPYASGISGNASTVSWVLNEPATDVKIIFDNGAATNDLGSAPVVGTNSFSFSGHTNFSIVVYKGGANAITQISSDANLQNSFGGPAGVVVNQNAKTGNFGRIYVANANPVAANSRITTSRGIYVMDAASGDVLNQGNTAATAGMSLGTSTTWSPYKLGLGPDDNLYVGDCATGTIGGVWRVAPNLSGSTNIFNLANPSTNTLTAGTNFGRIIGTPNVTGSLAGGNLVLTLTAWDLNLANPPGTFLSQAAGYQNIYQYNIGGGTLPWKNFPTVITNPISYSTVNTVTMDVQVAPDGKYFITAYRYNPSEGVTNVCVLDSTGTKVLWDSKTISRTYFNDSVVDHLDFANTSISVSPDDKYVLIQGSTNMTFLLMALTNGVPDISTLTTNSPAGTTSGVRCWASAWDAADNIYVTSTAADYLRVFSLGLTTTCTTSNDATFANGGFKMTAISAANAVIQTQPASQSVQCENSAAFSVGATGVNLNYQWYLAGSGAVANATSSSLSLSGVTVAQSGRSYTVIVSNTLNSVTSQVAVLTVADTVPPLVTMIGNATTNLLQGTPFVDPGATAFDACAGALPVATNGTVNVNVGGTYYLSYVATDPSGNSATNTRTVNILSTNGPPVISQQPSNQTAQCESAVVFGVVAYGALPMTYQWYDGAQALSNGPAISGATTASLTLSSLMLSESGNYNVVIVNGQGGATSHTVTLTVSDSASMTVTVLGSTVMSVVQGTSFIDPGATASDTCVGILPVTTNGSVNINATGIYVLTYTATNALGNSASAQRTVTVTPGSAPVTASTPNIIPLPVVMSNRAGIFTLCPPQPAAPVPSHGLMKILVDASSQQTGQYLAAALAKSTGCQFQLLKSTATNAVKGAILITTSNAIATLGAEGYELTVAPDSVLIRAPAQGGAFYGVQTFLQLLPPQIYSPRIVTGVAWAAPCIYIKDYPLFSWRGVMLDVARHFFNKQEVKQVLDAMAMHKLNTFHWHLVDDQGWRLQITNYPNLTTLGAWRNAIDYGLPPRSTTATNSAGQYGGFYTQADAREIVAYAAERHITVVPELEMPCHSDAGLYAYGQFSTGDSGDYTMDYYGIQSLYGIDLYSLGSPGTMAFLEDALAETMAIFPGKYIHCGGDEVIASGDTHWNSYTPDVTNMEAQGITPNGTNSITKYQHWFSTVLSSFIQAHGHEMIAWSEFEDGGVIPNAAVMDWQTGTASRAIPVAEAGLPVVMSPDSSCYINYIEGSSSSLPIEPPFVVGGNPGYLSIATVYAFNPIPSGLPAAYTNNILGAQCNLWGEYVPSFRNVMLRMFPRETAMAEITWTPKAQQSYTSFTSRLAVEEKRFAQMGLNYDHESIPVIGTWGPTVSASATTMSFNITTNVTAAGEIDVSFWYTSGANLSISSVALLVNGVQVDIDSHSGLAEPSSTYQASEPFIQVFTVYIVHLPELKANATYTIQAVVQSSGGTTTSGTVYLPNWN